MNNEQTKRKHTLADAQEAAARLILLPNNESKMSEADLDFLRSDLVGELLEGKYAHVFDYVRGITRNSQWILTIPVKPQ